MHNKAENVKTAVIGQNLPVTKVTEAPITLAAAKAKMFSCPEHSFGKLYFQLHRYFQWLGQSR